MGNPFAWSPGFKPDIVKQIRALQAQIRKAKKHLKKRISRKKKNAKETA